MELTKDKQIKFYKEKKEFHKQQKLINETRVESTKIIVGYLNDKLTEYECKTNQDAFDEMLLRLETLKEWVLYDTIELATSKQELAKIEDEK